MTKRCRRIFSTANPERVVTVSADPLDAKPPGSSLPGRAVPPTDWLVPAALDLAVVVGLWFAVRENELYLTAAVILGLFAVLTIEFAFRFLRTVNSDPPRLESHWGGLGGTAGGWRVSTSLVYLFAALAFGMMTSITIGGAQVPPARDPGRIHETDADQSQLRDTTGAPTGEDEPRDTTRQVSGN